MIKELIQKNRSYRRFIQQEHIDIKTLKELIELTRFTPSTRNQQPLRYILANNEETNAKIFPHLAWAGYLQDWSGPAEGEKPSAYIIVLDDKENGHSFDCDCGIVAQSMLLGAVEKGYGGCIIKSIKKDALRKSIFIPNNLEVQLIIALGKPNEEIMIEPMKNNDIKYWRDANDVHHVPKRVLDELIIKI